MAILLPTNLYAEFSTQMYADFSHSLEAYTLAYNKVWDSKRRVIRSETVDSFKNREL